MARDSTDLQGNVTDLVCASWEHGMPLSRVFALGQEALPLLAEMLRDEDLKLCWANASMAIGVLGDTSYFDTLRTFIWDRYRGDVEMPKYIAIARAQTHIAGMAAASPRALDYLLETVDPAAWRSVPWRSRVLPEDAARYMASSTISSLARVDHPRARAFLDTLSADHYAFVARGHRAGSGAPSPEDVRHVESLRRRSREVHSMGIRAWIEKEERESIFSR